MRLFTSWAASTVILGSIGAAAAEEIKLSCELDIGARWELLLDLEAKTLGNPIGPPVEITEQNRGWIVAHRSASYAATSETRSGDYATAQTWTINRLTGELWASYFLATSSQEAPVVMRTFKGTCG